MKPAFLLFGLTLLFANPLHAKTLIVSDIDDTIKLTDVLNSNLEIVRNGLFSKKAFSGMSTLYRELGSSAEIYYVSGSPEVIKPVLTNFMSENKFPQGRNLLLRPMKVESFDHKIASITKLIEAKQPDEVILIGDDGEKDPEIYDQISKHYPSKVTGIYIRAIQNRILPVNPLMRNFFSSVEIAGVEHIKGKIGVASVSKVVKSFIKQDNESEIAIKNRYCPKEGRIELEEIKQKVNMQLTADEIELTQEKIIKTCSKRSIF